MTATLPRIRHSHFLEPETLADPYPLLATLRERETELAADRIGSVWLFRYDSVSAALRDPRLSVASVGENLNRLASMALRPEERVEFADAFAARTDMLFYVDPPRHTQLRRLLQSWFSPAYVAQLNGRIAEITGALLDQIEYDEPFDLVETFANRLPSLVIAEIIGIPAVDSHVIVDLSDGLVATASRGRLDRRWTEGGRDAIESFRAYLKPLMEKRRLRPTKDLLSSLVSSMEDQVCSEREIAALCMTLAVGGYETTRGLIANAFAILLRNPAQFIRLQAQPELIGSAIEEVIRLESPVQVTARIATEPVSIGSMMIGKGTLVECFIGAANRDPLQFTNPDLFDITRSPNRHLGFSLGHHHCLGVALSRMEATVAILEIMRRWPSIHLQGDSIEWKASGMFRQPSTLNVSPTGR